MRKRNVDRSDVERWLSQNGFALRANKTSHRQYVGHGVTVTLPGHGPKDLTKKVQAFIRRQLVGAGFAEETLPV